MIKHSTILRCLKNNFIKFPPTCGSILDIEILSWKLRSPIRAQNMTIFDTVVSKCSTLPKCTNGQSYDVPSKTFGPPPVSRHLSILLEAMILAMIILALMDSYLAKWLGKDNRTRDKTGKPSKEFMTLEAIEKVSLKHRVLYHGSFICSSTGISGLLWHRLQFSRKQEILFDY